MEVLNDSLKLINRIRIAQSTKQKAQEFVAKVEAERVNSWNKFLEKHSGGHGLRNGFFYDCIANRQMLEGYVLDGLNEMITFEALEKAFAALRDDLAHADKLPYERRSNTQQSRHFPQLKSFSEPEVAIPFTKDQILAWSKDTLKKWMSKGPRYVAAINKKLRS